MREQLIQYVDLLFAGAPDAADIKQEILQNTLDRYDDLIAEGKSPQAAYQLAISGIGDINEILSSRPSAAMSAPQVPAAAIKDDSRKWVRAVAIAFFILCPVPILILESSIGVCLCLALIAAGVALLTAYGKESASSSGTTENRRSALNRGINGGIWGGGLCVYFLVSLTTGDWHITWLIFPMLGSISGIVDAIFDLNKSTVSAVIRVVLFSILLLVLVVCVLGLTLPDINDSYLANGTVGSEGSVSAAEVRDIQIEWVSGSITIKPGNTEDIQFHETLYNSGSKQLIWKQSGDKLIIQFSQNDITSFIHFGINTNYSKDLVVTVPQDWIGDEINIESVSAAVNVNDLTCNEIDLNNVSGECFFTNCAADTLSLETVSGGIDYHGTLQSLNCESVSADCEINVLNHPRQIEMDGVSCDLTLYLPESCGFTVSMDSMSGDFTTDFSTISKNGYKIYGDGYCRIEADSMSGDIIIRNAG